MEPMLVRFSEQAIKWLRKEAKRLGIPVAEMIRRIVDEKREAKENKK